MLASHWLNAAIRQLHGQDRRTKVQTRDPPYMAAIARSSRSTKGDHVPRQTLRYVPCSATMLVFGSSEMEVAQELAAKRAEENSRQRSTESPSWQERAAWLLLCGVLVGVGLYILANFGTRSPLKQLPQAKFPKISKTA